MQMIFNLFKSKTAKRLDQLREKFLLGNIPAKEYKAKVYEISPKTWQEIATPEEKQLRDINTQYNADLMSKEEYKNKIKNLDPETYEKMLEPDEKYVYDLVMKLENGKITKEEYEKELKTVKKEPFIGIKKIEFDKESSQYMFEFDWNDYFIDELRENGFTGTTQEEIIDEWFTAFSTMVAADSDKVIVTDPDDIRKVTKKKNTTEHY